jgi:hypothetical protein
MLREGRKQIRTKLRGGSPLTTLRDPMHVHAAKTSYCSKELALSVRNLSREGE